jgi:hypothetical protein
VNGDCDLILKQPQGFCGGGIENLSHVLNFGKMVTRPESAQLTTTPLVGPLRYPVRIGSVYSAACLEKLQITLIAHSLAYSPSGTSIQYAD